MKRFLFIITIVSSITLFSIATLAQSTKNILEISGTIADSLSKKPLDFVTINLTTDGVNAIRATYSKENGTFKLAGIKPLTYTLIINYVGYATKKLRVNMPDTANFIMQLGTIYLSHQHQQLKEVVIQSTKPLIKQEADRVVYDLQADPDSKGSAVFDMLRKIPYLSIDADENILLKGKADYKIFINGRPSGMVESNPKAILKSMPAATIQRIEVITNPSSKYDAEGYAGIINIVTNKKLLNGYNGTLNVNASLPVGGPGAGGSFNARLGALGISAYGGASSYNAPQTTYFNNRVTTGSIATNLDQSGFLKSDSRSGYLGGELSYEIDSLNLVSAQFNVNGNKADGSRSQLSILTKNTQIDEGYDLQNKNGNHNSGFDAALNYQLGFKAHKNRLLTFSYRYLTYNNSLFNDIAISNRINYDNPDYQQNNEGITDEQTIQVDYVHPIRKVNIEGGVKAIFRNNSSNFQYYSLLNGNYIADAGMSNHYGNKQVILAAYNSYRFTLNTWDFSGGMRLERTGVDADFISTASQVNQDYFNLVPSFSLNKNFKNKSSLNFGFSQRIQRPGINRLNPFVNRSNPNFVSSGNPGLRPSAINNVQLGYNLSKKLSINLGVTYSFLKDLALQISTFDAVTKITYITYENLGEGDAFNTSFNLSYPATKALNLSINGNITYINLEGMSNGNLINTSRFSENISAAAGYRFNKGWRLNTNFQFNGRNQTSLQSRSNAMFSASLGVNKDIIQNKLSFSATLSNPFTKYRNNIIETTGPDFLETNVTRNYFRSYRISLNYNFGKLKEAIKKNKRGIKNDDLSN
jgi:ferric enterobactin receptor